MASRDLTATPCGMGATRLDAGLNVDLRAVIRNTADAAIGLYRDRPDIAEALRTAAETMDAQRLSNMALHRRVQEAEAATAESAKVAKAISRARWAENWARQSFARMMASSTEIRIIYDHIRRVRDDGCDDYGYHSVMDSRADGGPQVPGATWANRYKSRRGGIVSVRPSEVIGALVDELLALRALGNDPASKIASSRSLPDAELGPGRNPISSSTRLPRRAEKL